MSSEHDFIQQITSFTEALGLESWDCSTHSVLGKVSESATALLKKASEETSGFLDALVQHRDDPGQEEDACPGVILQKNAIDTEENASNFQECMHFLKFWYFLARKRLTTSGQKASHFDEVEPLFEKHSPEFRQRPLFRKYISLLASLTQHSGIRDVRHNCHMVLQFFQNVSSSPNASIYEDIKACQLNLRIQEDVFKLAPECSVLKKIALEEISRYHENYEGKEFTELKRVTAQFKSRISDLHTEMDWFDDEKKKKRFLFFKALVEKMAKFADDACRCAEPLEFFDNLGKCNPEGQPQPISFLRTAFNLLSVCFATINEVDFKYSSPIAGLVRMNPEAWWLDIVHGIKTTAAELRNRLVSAANEAATHWLQREMSGFCHDVCMDTALYDSSTRYYPEGILQNLHQSRRGDEVGTGSSSERRDGNFTATGISRRANLAVDMHSKCQDLIGMRVWYLDAVPTGGFNHVSKTSVCGVMVVHVFLRNNIAIKRLREHPEKMQAQISSGNNVACGNVQLPSWVQDACVSRLFYQPLLDFLLHNFDLCLNTDDREPVRLVFTGSAFDAVLATVVASELLSRFNSYREDRLINKRHNHTAADWDILYNHIRSSVFVLSFLLPAVFSGPHLSPHQLSAKGRGADKEKQTPHSAIGVNMLNITFSNCVAFKIVEHWLSVDRNDLVHREEEWESLSKYDSIVIETLQKLFSCCKKTPQFTKSIEQAASDVMQWADSFKVPKRPHGTFVADFKGKDLSLARTSPRLVNDPKIARCHTVLEKMKKKSTLVKVGETVARAGDWVFVHHSDDMWLGCLRFVLEPPFQLLSCTHKTPSADREMMDCIASWFMPVASVYEVSQPTSCVPFALRERASYGTLNASDIRTKRPVESSDVLRVKSSSGSDLKQPTNICMQSRMSVKPLGNNDSRRLLIQWTCDSKDSHALIRNCFEVALTVGFNPHHDTIEFQTEDFLSSDLRVTVSEHDYESLYSLQCEAEIPIPASCKHLEMDQVISSTVIFVAMRMRFFSAQFGHGRVTVSDSDVSRTHNCFGPELFCFPKRLIFKEQLQRFEQFDDAFLFWFWFYVVKGKITLDDALGFLSELSLDGAIAMIRSQHFDKTDSESTCSSGFPPRFHFREVLMLEKFYNKHEFYFDGLRIENAYDFTFCDFEIQDPETKSYNSRYIHMHLDELLMQAWDFKLLALNAYGRNEDLQTCQFPDCDLLIRDFDYLCDRIAQKFRGSQQWSSKLSKNCEACLCQGRSKERHSCKLHMYDYLNDDEEGLEYVRKQSSYLRRFTFSKSLFKQISNLFREQQKKAEIPSQRFYQSITDCLCSIADTHSLMVKLVASPQEGNPNATLMTQRSYDGIFNAFFVPPIQPRSILEKGDKRVLVPRFPTNLYDNELFALGKQQDYRHFPTADAKEGGHVIPACSLVSKPSDSSHHFRSIFRVLATGAQKGGGWNSHRTEAEFTSWAHGMGVLRSFAIRKEFEAFCSFFQNAKERRSVLSWLRRDIESADPYFDCLHQIHHIFEDVSNSSNRLKDSRDDYFALEERILGLICRHDKCGYGNRELFKKEMMSARGRKAFEQKVSFLPRVMFMEKLAKFIFFRDRNFWASWITTFVCFMSHIHQLREWLMNNKRCVAAFGDQKVGKSRFWSHSLGIETNPSSQSNTVQTQMWMLPHSQFIDFPAFSEENKLGNSYNDDQFVRCDMLARHIVFDFLLVPDICVYIVKTISPNTESVRKLIAHIRELETNRYPSLNAYDNDSAAGGEFDLDRVRSSVGRGSGSNNRLARESILLCSHTQNFICRLEPVNLDVSHKLLTFDPKLLSVDKGNMAPEHLMEISNHPELKKSKFVWVCGSRDGTDEHGHAVKIIQKYEVEGKVGWRVVGQEASTAQMASSSPGGQAAVDARAVEDLQSVNSTEIWNRLRTKLIKKKETIGEMFSSKNVFLAYFAEYATEFNSPFDLEVENHIEKDFPWSSAFCQSTLSGTLLDATAGPEDSFGDLPILNASQCLKLILRKIFTSEQMQSEKLRSVIDSILLRPIKILNSDEVRDDNTEAKACVVCTADEDMRDEAKHQNVNFMCNECNIVMCETHANVHMKKKGVHTVNRSIDKDAEEKRLAQRAAALLERDHEERIHPNSYTNRQKREKIWRHQQHAVVVTGESLIEDLCGDVVHGNADQVSCGHIQHMLKLLDKLRDELAFDSSHVANTNEALKTMKLNLGIAFWSYLMGDSDEIDERTANVFCSSRIIWRSLGESPGSPAKYQKFRCLSSLRPSLAEALQRPIQDVVQQFISDANSLWNEIKEGGRSLKQKLAAIKPVVILDPQKLVTAGDIDGEKCIGGASNLSSAQTPIFRVVPWFSAVFYEMLRESGCNYLNVTSDIARIPMDEVHSRNIVSQEFCLALLKIILLPLLASKKCSDASISHDLRVALQYGDDFCLTFFYLEKAMFSCLNSEAVLADYPLFAWLSVKSSPEDHSTRSVDALRLLFRSISLKGFAELECLDVQPSIAVLACENLTLSLFESRSAFESFFTCSSLAYSTKEHSLRSLIDNTQQAFDKVQQWILKPVRQVEAKIGKNWKSVSKISQKENFERLFKISALVARQFEAVKERMHKLVDGSYASVSVDVFDELLNQLDTLPDNSVAYFDVPLMGRALMGLKTESVPCYLVEPCFCFFECKLVSILFQSSNGIEKEVHYLRLSLQSLKKMKIDLVPLGAKFEFIVNNCSTVFIEEAVCTEAFDQRVRPIPPERVHWCDLSLPEREAGKSHPAPLYDCQVELQPIPTFRLSLAGDQPSTVQNSGCVVGQRVMMNISFCFPFPIDYLVRIFVVLDDAFEYGSPRNGNVITIFPHKQETEYHIKNVVTDKGKYSLLEVLFDPEGQKHEGRITLSFAAKNPNGERLFRRACLVYLRHGDVVDFNDDMDIADNPTTNTDFVIKTPRQRPCMACLGCGIAQTPAIYNLPLKHCEILVSKALLGESNVDLMLTFKCSARVLVFHPDVVPRTAVVEIDLPPSWPHFAEHGLSRHVTFSCDAPDGEALDIQAGLGEFVRSKIIVRLSAGAKHQGQHDIFLKENSQCCVLVQGITLPQAPDELIQSLAMSVEANTRLEEGVLKQLDYEKLKKDAEDAKSKLQFLKESLTFGCNVTIRDANGSIVMTGRDVPISPLLSISEYKTVIERGTFEASHYKTVHDGPKGTLPLGVSFSDHKFYFCLESFTQAFVAQKYGGDAGMMNSVKVQRAIERYHADLSEALKGKNISNLTKSIKQQLEMQGQQQLDSTEDSSPFKVTAMAIQLWSSPIILELDNQPFRFFEMMNRYTLSADSEELLEKAMLLIKAIKHNLVTHDRGARAALSGGKTAESGTLRQNALPRSISVKPAYHEMYFRGGTLPYEMAGFFFPGKVFRFPVFLATSCKEIVGVDFACKVKEASERTLWRFSAPPNCLHFKALQDNSLVAHEEEFLFPPYSAFRVISNRLDEIQHPTLRTLEPCRIICLEALADNTAPEAQNVPTAPRY